MKETRLLAVIVAGIARRTTPFTRIVGILLCFLAGCALTPKEAILKAAREGNAEKSASLVGSVPSETAIAALDSAAQFGNLSVVQAMVAHGVDINGGEHTAPQAARPLVGVADMINWVVMGKGHVTSNVPLIYAAAAGKLEVVKWLVEHGANLEAQAGAVIVAQAPSGGGIMAFAVSGGNNALSVAILGGHSAVVHFLVEHGADISRRVIYSSADIPAIVAFSVDEGFLIYTKWGESNSGVYPDPEHKHFYQTTDGVIHTDLQIRMSQELSIRELLARSAIPEIKALSTKPPSIKETFLGACKTGTPEQVTAALQGGADVNARGQNGRTPLIVAAGLNPDPGVVAVLLKAGADPNASMPPLGMTPLMIAVTRETPNLGVIAVLLKAGADLNAKDRSGNTALDFACDGNHPKVVEALRKAGAQGLCRPRAPSNKG